MAQWPEAAAVPAHGGGHQGQAPGAPGSAGSATGNRAAHRLQPAPPPIRASSLGPASPSADSCMDIPRLHAGAGARRSSPWLSTGRPGCCAPLPPSVAPTYPPPDIPPSPVSPSVLPTSLFPPLTPGSPCSKKQMLSGFETSDPMPLQGQAQTKSHLVGTEPPAGHPSCSARWPPRR